MSDNPVPEKLCRNPKCTHKNPVVGSVGCTLCNGRSVSGYIWICLDSAHIAVSEESAQTEGRRHAHLLIKSPPARRTAAVRSLRGCDAGRMWHEARRLRVVVALTTVECRTVPRTTSRVPGQPQGTRETFLLDSGRNPYTQVHI